ncbi:MAG TPA: P-loop NTPase fold protein [Vicinamibacterales bacterium]|nr:P-loop NTPase fold protein [Vicinamibacterales bacterium]
MIRAVSSPDPTSMRGTLAILSSSQETSGHVCPTQLVSDAPAEKDAFGAHGRIAAAIAQLISTSPGGKSIGLLGTWGAGKSTVVEILRKHLENDPRYVVWLFDAWAHEGDSLRRMFLESLTQRLTEKEWLTGKEWKERLEILAKRRKVVEQSNTPSLSPLAIALAVSLLLVPVGLDLWGNRLDAGLSFDPALSVDWAAVIGLMGVFAPLVVLVCYVGAVLFRGGTVADLRQRLPAALTLFVRQTDAASRTETLDTGEPTSLEFERVFCEVMQAALTPPPQNTDPDRRLVLVVDNLDRVGAEQGLSMWSTLQTFVRHRETREPWLDGLWCLLPFDGDAIRRLWPQDSLQGSHVAESFLDKTFQVRFEVPLPLLSDWKDYVMARLKEAMPEHSDGEYFRIYRLYAVRRTPATPAPTPRELKLFVNQVGSLHRQWQDEIPLPDLAYFALLQRDKVPITADSIGQLPEAGEAGLLSDKIRQHLAAMAYGVPIESAQELLLKEPIMQALEAPDPQALKTLSDSNDAFWLVLEQALWRGCEEWPHAEGGKLLHAVVALEESEITTHEPAWRVDQWFRPIEAATERVGSWAPMDARAVDGILLLSRRKPALAAPMFQAFVATRTGDPGWGSGLSIPSFLDDYARMTSGLGEWMPQPPRVVQPSGDGSAVMYGRLASELVARDPEGKLWAHFPPSDPNLLIGELAAKQLADPELVASVRVAQAGSVGARWSVFITSADVRLRSQEVHQEGHQHLLAALHALWNEPSAVEVLKGLVDEGTARQLFTTAFKDRNLDLQAAWFYTIARVDPEIRQVLYPSEASGSEPLMPAWSQIFSDAAFCDSLARTVVQMGDTSTIFQVAQRSWQAKDVMLSVLQALAALGPPARVFPPHVLVDQWSLTFPDTDPYVIARLLSEHNPRFTGLLSAEPFRLDMGSLYTGALEAEGVDTSSLVARCLDIVRGLDAPGWERALEGDASLGRLVWSLLLGGSQVALGEAAGEGLRRLVPRLAEAGVSVAGDHYRKAVFDAIEPAVRPPVLNAIVDRLTQASELGNMHRLLSMPGQSVFESDRLAGNAAAFSALAWHVLENLNDEWLAALARAATANPRLMSQLGNDDRSQIGIEIETQQTKRSSDQARKALRELGDALIAASRYSPPAEGPAMA